MKKQFLILNIRVKITILDTYTAATWHDGVARTTGERGKEMSEYILELKDVVKTFGGVTALDGVHFQLKKGEIHALMGENGAGKSTFIKVITGVHQPDSGMMLLEGEKITLRSTEDSAKLGNRRNLSACYGIPGPVCHREYLYGAGDQEQSRALQLEADDKEGKGADRTAE